LIIENATGMSHLKKDTSWYLPVCEPRFLGCLANSLDSILFTYTGSGFQNTTDV
jgi:hypothetical protein